ncbi:MAG: hypothetical protein IKQ75_06580 [Bacteroidales bacterium]|nr:hypothetical protein [Bacteroidales bacterium]MBR6161514.1 hypothetical protein [Bacteroidales bacterium]
MKKLMILMAACCLVFASCNKKAKEDPVLTPEQQEMAEKQKQYMKDREDWINWENQTDERKAELLNKSKTAYEKKKAAQEEREARKAKFEEALANWENLSLDERRAAFELLYPSKPENKSSDVGDETFDKDKK